MAAVEALSEEQGPCSICHKPTFNRPNWDGSITCSLRCLGKWLDAYMAQDKIDWEEMKQEIRGMINVLKSEKDGMGMH